MMKLVALALAVAACSDGKPDPKLLKEVGLATKDYAFSAYPSWAAAHPAKECPDSLADLDEYMDHPAVVDPWGGKLLMLCGAKRPPQVRGGIAVVSLGPDGKLGTADDITSY